LHPCTLFWVFSKWIFSDKFSIYLLRGFCGEQSNFFFVFCEKAADYAEIWYNNKKENRSAVEFKTPNGKKG